MPLNFIISPGKLAFDPEKIGERLKPLPYICMGMTMLVSKIPTPGTSGIFFRGLSINLGLFIGKTTING